MPPNEERMPLLTRIVAVFLRGDIAILLTIVSLLLGGAALHLTPREEDPQIVVPMADVFISAPGLSAQEVERKVATRLEKLLYQIDGVEHVYSMSRPGQCIVTVRYYVGEDRVESLVKLYNKINSNIDQVPPSVDNWVVKPVEIDDVPIAIVTLWSQEPQRYDDHELRRIGEEIQLELKRIRKTNRVHVVSGRPRRIRVELDPVKLAARRTSAVQVMEALKASNVNVRTGGFPQRNEQLLVEAGTFLRNVEQLKELVIRVVDGRPVHLKDVARVIDGPAEVENYSWIGFGPATQEKPPDTNRLYPAVHVAVAKRKGANAVWVADSIEERMQRLAETHLPEGVHYRITRDYGETANDKVNELVEGLTVAVLTVIGLIGLTLGWRPALVIALAVPVCYSLTLFINLMVGYTINRVTLFALILALGLLVDDPITDVENVARYFAMRILPARESVLQAIQEVRPALILSTLAIIVSFLPMAFITGMMGPYMAPMALNVPLTVAVSTIVAFVITPWLAMASLRKLLETGKEEEPFELTKRPLYRFFSRTLRPVIATRAKSWLVLGVVMLLLLGAVTLPLFRVIPLKMLPYDNKNEFQVIVDMPEGTTLDETDAVARRLGRYLSRVSEVRDYEVYAGTASPMDFNGMVRHYYLRNEPHMADIRVNLAPKVKRTHQSHEIILRIRRDIDKLAHELGANVKLVEMPPGPPVLATITAEVYAPPDATYAKQIAAARRVKARLERAPNVVDEDTSAQAAQQVWVFETDKRKASLSGVSTKNIARTVQMALDGLPATILHRPREVDPLQVVLRVPRPERSAIDELEELYVVGKGGELVQLGALGKFKKRIDDQTIYHKDLRRVVYAYSEVAGRPPTDAILDIQFDRRAEDSGIEGGQRSKVDNRKSQASTANLRPSSSAERSNSLGSSGKPRLLSERTWLDPGGGVPWTLPAGYTVEWAGEGEWQITLDVFRDLGVAFGAALIGIFTLLMFQTGSRILPLIIMLAIPLTLIGIMPGFWLLNALTDQPIGGYPNPTFFTATAMIGMIALAGIVVRNSVVLIDFIHFGLKEGHGLQEAIVRSVAVRTRPILLTAGTTLLGNWVITLDPIFSGLAWAIIFGILTSTLFTLVVIPIVYSLIFNPRTQDRLLNARGAEPKE